MSNSQLQYRLYTDKDLPGILELWEKYSGWGAITQEQYNNWYLQTPYGPCVVIVAVDDKENTVGQIVFIPSIIYYQGKLIKGLRVSSPILNDQIRDIKITDYNHPIYAMFRIGIKESKKLDYEIVYMFPSKGWTTVLKTFPKYKLPEPHIAFYDCFAISLETAYCKIDKTIRTEILQNHFNEDFDELWRDATEQFPLQCSVKRNADWLQWKNANNLVFIARHALTNHLIGYAAINKKSGLIVDMLARTKEDLQKVLQSVIYSLHFSNPDRFPIQLKKLSGMFTPVMQSVLENMVFEKEDFTFAFSCFSLQDAVSFQSISPINWYMMPND